MITVRKSNDRGHKNHGWLDTYHSFSFAAYYDPDHMGFRSLRVINQDRVRPGQGFGWHPHQDMEIITVILEGALEHKDSMGNGEVMNVGDVQRMSAGSGIYHSEFNHSKEEDVHLFQIWLLPEKKAIEPSYEQKHFTADTKRNTLKALVSKNKDHSDALSINQDATLFASILDSGQSLDYTLEDNRHAWLQLIRGELDINGTSLKAGDAAAISEEEMLRIKAGGEEAEFLLFDLA